MRDKDSDVGGGCVRLFDVKRGYKRIQEVDVK
jgi:hypothetical protein